MRRRNDRLWLVDGACPIAAAVIRRYACVGLTLGLATIFLGSSAARPAVAAMSVTSSALSPPALPARFKSTHLMQASAALSRAANSAITTPLSRVSAVLRCHRGATRSPAGGVRRSTHAGSALVVRHVDGFASCWLTVPLPASSSRLDLPHAIILFTVFSGLHQFRRGDGPATVRQSSSCGW